MKKHRSRSRLNIPMCLACILFCLTLFSVHFTNNLFAKYSTSASGSDSARVIRFGDVFITETGDFTEENSRKVAIVPGVNLTKDVSVTFEGSEAATFVFLEVALKGWNTSDNFNFAANGTFEDDHKITWGIAKNTDENAYNDWTYLTNTTDTETGVTTYVYYIAVDPNVDKLKDVSVINEGLITVPSEITRAEYKTLGNMTITFSATVVQAGGFADASAAWNSVKPVS